MSSASSKSEAETTEIASTVDPIDTITVGSDVSSSLNNDKSESNSEDDDYSDDGNENSGESDEEGEEEEEDDDDDDDDDSESDGEDDRDSIVDDGDSTDSKPERGEDSFDEAEYWSPDEDNYSDEEEERIARLYLRNLYSSHGFLVEEENRPRGLWSGSIMLNDLDSEDSPVRGRTQLQYAQDMAKLSLRKYNALNGTDVKLGHVVRVTESFSGRWISYITFMAREEEEEYSRRLVEYQAKIVKKLRRKSYPIFCRPSPKLDQDM